MEQTFPTEAIVLDRQVFREYDSRICVYSLDHGQLDLVARGTKRSKSKLAGHIEPISELNLMVVRGKQYDYVGSAVGINSFSQLKNNYDLLVESGQVMKMLKRIIEPGVSDDRIFYLLKEYLEIINSKDISKKVGSLAFIFFIFNFLSLLGYAPEMGSYSSDASRAIKKMLNLKIEEVVKLDIPDKTIKNLKKMLDDHVKHSLDYAL